MTVTIATASNAYNERRYSTPWAAEIVDGKYEFIRGAWYDGKEIITIEDPQVGHIYACGQKDKRGGNTANLRAMWDGEKFVPLDSRNNPTDDGNKTYAGNVHLVLDVQVDSKEYDA